MSCPGSAILSLQTIIAFKRLRLNRNLMDREIGGPTPSKSSYQSHHIHQTRRFFIYLDHMGCLGSAILSLQTIMVFKRLHLAWNPMNHKIGSPTPTKSASQSHHVHQTRWMFTHLHHISRAGSAILSLQTIIAFKRLHLTPEPMNRKISGPPPPKVPLRATTSIRLDGSSFIYIK